MNKRHKVEVARPWTPAAPDRFARFNSKLRSARSARPGAPQTQKSKEPAAPKVLEVFVGVTIAELARALKVKPERVEGLLKDIGEAPVGPGRYRLPRHPIPPPRAAAAGLADIARHVFFTNYEPSVL